VQSGLHCKYKHPESLVPAIQVPDMRTESKQIVHGMQVPQNVTRYCKRYLKRICKYLSHFTDIGVAQRMAPLFIGVADGVRNSTSDTANQSSKLHIRENAPAYALRILHCPVNLAFKKYPQVRAKGSVDHA